VTLSFIWKKRRSEKWQKCKIIHLHIPLSCDTEWSSWCWATSCSTSGSGQESSAMLALEWNQLAKKTKAAIHQYWEVDKAIQIYRCALDFDGSFINSLFNRMSQVNKRKRKKISKDETDELVDCWLNFFVSCYLPWSLIVLAPLYDGFSLMNFQMEIPQKRSLRMHQVGKLHMSEFQMHGYDGNHLVIGCGKDIFIVQW